MRDERLSQALADCLDALNDDDWDVESLVKRYPGLDEKLRPLLEVAASLRRGASPLKPSEAVRQRLRARLDAILRESGTASD